MKRESLQNMNRLLLSMLLFLAVGWGSMVQGQSTNPGTFTVTPVFVCGQGTYSYTFTFLSGSGTQYPANSSAQIEFPAGWAGGTYTVTAGGGNNTSVGTVTPSSNGANGGYVLTFPFQTSNNSGFTVSVAGVPMPDEIKYTIYIKTRWGAAGTYQEISGGNPYVISSIVNNGHLSGGTTSCSSINSAKLELFGHTGTILRWEKRDLIDLVADTWTSWSTIGSAGTGTTYNLNASIIDGITQFRVVTSNATCGTPDPITNLYYSNIALLAEGVTAPIILATDIDKECEYDIEFGVGENVQIFSVTPIQTVIYTYNSSPITSPYTFTSGTHTVYATATNQCGSTTEPFEVKAGDVEPPVITDCPEDEYLTGCNVSVILTETGFAYSTTEVQLSELEFIGLGGAATDNCGIVSYYGYYDSQTGSCPIVVTRTFVVKDAEDNATTCEQTIEIEAPAVTYTEPVDETKDACDYADQAAVNTAFNAWVTAQTAYINVGGGCDPQIANNIASVTIPEWCDGGDVDVTWTITDLCETITLTATWTLTPAPAVTYEEPVDETKDACDYADQNAVDAAFNAWVTAQTAYINVGGGCDPQMVNNSATVPIPAWCDGGDVDVTWTITDLCETITLTATWTLTPAPAVTYEEPVDETKDACDYADQNAVDAAFNAWVTAQTAYINVGGGCDPQMVNNSATVPIPAWCDGGDVDVTWTITDLCETITLTATWTLTPAPAVTYEEPVDETKDACDYADQNAVDAAFNAWVTAQTAYINVGGGCDPQMVNNSATVPIPAWCDGGDVDVTWTITDLCETITLTATWTLTPAPAVTYEEPVDETKDACDYADQNAVDAAFNAWVTAQTAYINVGGGCDPQMVNNSATVPIPAWCDGGDVDVTWTITDLCETITLTATWTLTPAPAVTYEEPVDETKDACDYADQNAVDAAFNAWVTAQTAYINVGGGCDPQMVNNSATVPIPAWCDGGDVDVTWTITDLCETITLTATWTLTPAPAVTYEEPVDETKDACDYADQTAVDAAFNAWVTAQTAHINAGGGCDPQMVNNSATVAIPAWCDGGDVDVTWTITDLCETITLTATWTLTPAPAVTYEEPVDETKDACDYADQNAVDAAFNAWVTAQTAHINVGGGCDPQIANNSASVTIPEWCDGGYADVTWTITDLCETITLVATWTLTPAPAVTYTEPVNETVDNCDFIDQDALNAAFDAWFAAQNSAIAVSIDGGCSPELDDNWDGVTYPDLCSSNSLTVTWTISDLCETITLSATFKVEVNTDPLVCEIDEVAEEDRPFCNTPDNTLTVVVTGGCTPYTYDWDVTSPDNTWSIQGWNPLTGEVTYTAGMVGDIATFTLTVTDYNGCQISTCTLELECQGGAFCTWTQGFYGNDVGQDCDNNTTTQLINEALGNPVNPITVGSDLQKSLTVNSALCVIGFLPAGGPSVALTQAYSCPIPATLSNNLVAQTLTLKLNMNIGDNGYLGNLKLPAGKDYMITAKAVDCYNFESEFVPGTEANYYVQKSVTGYLNANNMGDINGLVALADAAISGQYTPQATGDPTLLEIATMVDVINNAFHNCRVIVGWGNDPILPKMAQTVQQSADLNMYPNPTTGNVTILIPEEGFTHIRVVGLDGKTIMEVPQTELDGQFQVTLHMQNAARGIYYVFAYNNNVVASKGKLVIVR
jgi:hypothetical protein